MHWTFFVLVSLAIQGGAQLTPPPVREMVQQYIHGEPVAGALTAHVRTADAFQDFLRDFKREVRGMPVPLAAAFALEAASVAFRETPRDTARLRMPNALAVLEVGCSRLREHSTSPSDFDLRWHVLAADLIIRSTRRSNGSAETSYIFPPEVYDDHFKHVRERIHSDARVAISISRYDQGQFYNWRLTTGFSLVDADGVVSREGIASWGKPADRLISVITTLRPVLDHPEFGEEARVRSGDALLHLGREEEASALLGQGVLRDGTWEYLRRLVIARTLIQRGKAAAAADEYRAAVRIAPAARSANLALAGLAYLDGQHDVSQRLTNTAATATDPDPWISYMYPPASDWDARFTLLRKEARGH